MRSRSRLIVVLFVTKVLGTCTCTWLKKYLMYLMLFKYSQYLYLYLQVWKVLVLDSSTSESTWPQSWSPNGHGHEWPTAFVQCQSALPFWDTAISKFNHENLWWKSCVVKGQGHVWPSKFKGQGYGQGQTHWSHLRPGVQSICLLFVSWQSDHFWMIYRKFHIWPWKFKVKVMAKVKPDGHIWGLEFNQYYHYGNQSRGF